MSTKQKFDANKVTLTKRGYPYIVRQSSNNGQKGLINENPTLLNEGNTISFGQDTATAFYQEKPYFTGDKIKVLKPKDSRFTKLNAQFLLTTIRRAFNGFSWGTQSYSTEIIESTKLLLPKTQNGEIDFVFIDSFVRELERARLLKLEAYLKATGLDNYELTDKDKEVLNRLSTIQWKPFPITDVFTVRNTHNILASDVKLNSGNTPYLCASAENNGVGGYISYNQELIEPGNCVFIGGKTFVVSYQKADFFSNDSHNIALYIKDYTPTRNNLLTLATCVKKSLGHKYTWGDSVSKAKINRDTIMLPTIDGEHPDFAIMEQIIAAAQKIVIADVAKYTARNLEATQQVIDSQEEPAVEPTITPLHIHDTYQPGRIPLYTLRAACGYFDDGQLPEAEGWIDATGLGFTPDKDRYFAVHAKGDSMLPKIHDGDICIFEWYHAGSRNGEIVLSQSSEYDDAYGGRYTIKRYYSEKAVTDEGWQHTKVELQPLNPDFEPIVLSEDDPSRTIGIFKCVLD